MTEKQILFADEYLKDLNGTRAYKTIYTTIKNDNVAAVRANTLLKQKDISDYISKRLEEIHNENTADIQEVMEYLTSVLRGESASAVLMLSGNGMQKVTEKPPDEKERLKAAELLGKRFGMFKDNVDITSNGKTVIVDDIDE